MERLKPDERKQQIITAAVELAILKGGYKNITRDDIAGLANCSMGLINHYFGTVEELREEVIKQAIALVIPEIIVEALLDKSPLVENLPDELKIRAAIHVSSI